MGTKISQWSLQVAMSYAIRYANPADAALLHNIIRAAFAEYDGVLAVPPGALGETLQEVEQAIARGTALLAYDGGHAVGTVRYEVRPGYLYVGRLAVLPSHRGRGVGAALMSYVERLAPGLGRTTIHLGTRLSMPGNLAFYERLGYRVDSTEPHPRGNDTNVWFEKELKLDNS
ncbi:MAG: GNAT family N-acetyltransferase [Chloroflexota bacterium]|nr:GNAT family N-acetyltransferase [Chloroflexota bacterium]MDQ5866434.1 GNAT family N-acetyltransferase [Chloroflexota bacterium]